MARACSSRTFFLVGLQFPKLVSVLMGRRWNRCFPNIFTKKCHLPPRIDESLWHHDTIHPKFALEDLVYLMLWWYILVQFPKQNKKLVTNTSHLCSPWRNKRLCCVRKLITQPFLLASVSVITSLQRRKTHMTPFTKQTKLYSDRRIIIPQVKIPLNLQNKKTSGISTWS